MSKKSYYKGAARVLIDGVPCRYAFAPTPGMLEAYRTKTKSPLTRREVAEAIAERYARWIAARDGVSLRDPGNREIRARCEYAVPDGKDWSERRIACVHFAAGRDHSRYGIKDWREQDVIASVDIPHWDFEQSAVEQPGLLEVAA